MFCARLMLLVMVMALLMAEPALALKQFNGPVEGPAVVNTLCLHGLLRPNWSIRRAFVVGSLGLSLAFSLSIRRTRAFSHGVLACALVA